mgnify:CR=1 FL=1
MNLKFIDAHTHVQFAAYQDDVDVVVKRSLDAGIWMVNVGTQLDTSNKAIALAEQYPQGVYATVGLHPIHTDKSFHDKEELGEGGEEFVSRGEIFDYSEYKKLALNPKVVAIGECGLDYFRINSSDSKTKQAAAFIQQIELAHELKKPLMLHCRSAFPDLIKILTTNYKLLTTPYPGIIHFFSGSEPQASDLLNMGLFFTFGGVITFARDYDEIIKAVPVSRMMLETDAPYVTPAPHRGRRNEPVYVAEIAQKLAEIKGVSLEEIKHHTTENARAVFGI